MNFGGRVSALKSTLRGLRTTPVYRLIILPYRAMLGARVVFAAVPKWLRWIFASREETNFTYVLTEANILYLAHILAVVTGEKPEKILGYIEEITNDKQLADHVLGRIAESDFRSVSDPRIGLARRVGWYAMVRAMKPKVVIETGVDKGLGSVVICAALLHNKAEGHHGRFYGTDIVPTAGWLLAAPYSEVGEILYGDSLQSLRAFAENIDLFINDSDHSAEYEALEYEAILPKLSQQAVIFGDNSHATSKLAEFSSAQGRRFLFFKEEPKDHWYPGAGIGISY